VTFAAVEEPFEMIIAIVLCAVLLVLAREELGLITVFAILGFLVVAGTSLFLFQVSSLFFGVIVALVDIYLVIRLYGDIAIR
jgi:hypothetical protein